MSRHMSWVISYLFASKYSRTILTSF